MFVFARVESMHFHQNSVNLEFVKTKPRQNYYKEYKEEKSKMPMTKKEFNRRMSMMDKTILIKRELKSLLPEIEEDKYLHMLSHLCNFHNNKKQYWTRDTRKKTTTLKSLTSAEIVFLDYLLKNNLSPKTTYRWFLVSKLPEDIKEKLKKGFVSVAQARKVATNRLRQRESNEGLGMIIEIQEVVRCL